MGTKQLLNLFSVMEKKSKAVYFGDLMRKGYNSTVIKYAIELSNAQMGTCKDGYTVIYFN